MDDTEHSPRSRRPGSGAEGMLFSKDRLVFENYELRGILGEGGTGIVYDALRKSDSAAVALKVMHAHLAGDKQIRGRFQREAAILKRLEGPHICPILELGEVAQPGNGEPLLFMALPRIDGPTFERVLELERPVAVDRALDVMLEICAALRAAHGLGVIHRDLKPANVILESGKKAVVVDFGMSKIVTGAGTGTTNLTAHNMVFGTPEYMSPEQARGDELDVRCDVYAAGIMLYEILTGSPPFTGTTPLSVLTEHLTGTVIPPSKVAAEGRVTPALESVVMHALARDREQRYPSASALSAAIMHARARPDDVASLSPRAFMTPPAGTNPFAVTMPAIGSSSPPGATPVTLDQLDQVGASSDTLLASGPPAASSAPPPIKPSKSPSSAPRSSGSGPGSGSGSGGVVSRSGSGAPPASGSGSRSASAAARAFVAAPAADPSSTRLWILLWILAGLASTGIGVYFALRN